MKTDTKMRLRDVLLFILVYLGVIITLPLLAVAGFALRFVVIFGIPLLFVGMMAYPSVKRFMEKYDKNFVHISGLSLTKDVLLQPYHNWIKETGKGKVRVGIDDFSQKIVGNIREVVLPRLNTPIRKGAELLTVKSETKSLTFKSPVNGIVKGFNNEIFVRPELINNSPYFSGWILDIESDDTNQKQTDEVFEQAKVWLRQEVEHLIRIMSGHSQLAHVYQDGGVIDANISKHINDNAWQDIKDNLF